jgi:hypothetical protein
MVARAEFPAPAWPEREELVKIGARVVRRGRYVAFQLAEVAVPRALLPRSCAALIG